MKRTILYFAVSLMLISTGCNRENAEETVKGYISESLNDFKDQLPEELKLINSLLLDTTILKEKISETTNLDSLEEYNNQLKDAKNLLKKDISTLDSLRPEVMEMLDLNL